MLARTFNSMGSRVGCATTAERWPPAPFCGATTFLARSSATSTCACSSSALMSALRRSLTPDVADIDGAASMAVASAGSGARGGSAADIEAAPSVPRSMRCTRRRSAGSTSLRVASCNRKAHLPSGNSSNKEGSSLSTTWAPLYPPAQHSTYGGLYSMSHNGLNLPQTDPRQATVLTTAPRAPENAEPAPQGHTSASCVSAAMAV